MSTALTQVRKQALLLLQQAAAEDRHVRISNETNSNVGHLHWKPANWLIETGLAEELTHPAGTRLALTRAGRDIAAALTTTPSKD